MFDKIKIARAIEVFLDSNPVLTTAKGVGRSGNIIILTRQSDVKSV